MMYIPFSIVSEDAIRLCHLFECSSISAFSIRMTLFRQLVNVGDSLAHDTEVARS
jgi:hypothetical protein